MQISGSNVSTTTAQLGVNVVQLSGDATAADNAESFFDGTGYAGTNNVIPTVTTVTNLTNAPTSGDLTATMKASVNAEVDTALADINLDHLVKSAVDTNFATTVHLDSVIGHLADNGTTATFDRTTDALEVLGAAAVTLDGKVDVIDGIVDSILVDTAEIGVAGAGLTEAGGTGDHLTAIDLPDQTMNITGNLSGSVGSVTGAVGSVTAGVTVSTISANVITASALASDAANEIADAVLLRNVSNVESTAGEHTLCTVVLAMLENSISGTTLTIKRTDGTTTHATKTLTLDAAADPITGVA